MPLLRQKTVLSIKMTGLTYGRFFLAIVTAGRSGGGSTITQQLAKNAYLSQDQTVERKAKEFFLALELTKNIVRIKF